MTKPIYSEIARLEREARHRAMACTFDEANGMAAPVCDNIRESIDEMTEMVESVKLEVEGERQALRKQIGAAIQVHDDMRENYRQVVDHARWGQPQLFYSISFYSGPPQLLCRPFFALFHRNLVIINVL